MGVMWCHGHQVLLLLFPRMSPIVINPSSPRFLHLYRSSIRVPLMHETFSQLEGIHLYYYVSISTLLHGKSSVSSAISLMIDYGSRGQLMNICLVFMASKCSWLPLWIPLSPIGLALFNYSGWGTGRREKERKKDHRLQIFTQIIFYKWSNSHRLHRCDK